MLREHRTIEFVLARYGTELGGDATGYRNHVYRVANLCLLRSGDNDVDVTEKVAIAAVFHDLGIWTSRTFDYLPPSEALARQYLAWVDRVAWSDEVCAVIHEHHKLTAYGDPSRALVESFRRADLIDVSRGWRRFGIPHSTIRALYGIWPSAGFHVRLMQLFLRRLVAHPLDPLPMVRW